MVRRMSWALPQKGKDNFRKDLNVGLEGRIVGYADAEMRQVLLEVALTVNGKKEKFQQACTPRNLQLTSDYKISQAGATHGGDAEPEEPVAPPGMEWLTGDSKVGDLKVEHKWEDLVGDSDPLVRGMYLRGRVSNALQALMQALPTYTDDDFVIANRKTEKGVWKSELYTKRTFQPLEIMLGPCSSQLKETHMTLSANAPVGLPKQGPGSLPAGMHGLALDGRSRTLMAAAGSCDPKAHTGSLYWLVKKVDKEALANLEIEIASCEQAVTVHMPAFKKRKSCKGGPAGPVSSTWEVADMPTFPVLVNRKQIKPHTRLCVFQIPQKHSDEKK